MRPQSTRSISILFTATLLLLLGMQNAFATIHYVSPLGSDSNDGLSWATPKATVQGAINTYVSGDEVWVQAGTYTLTSQITAVPGLLLYGGFSGGEITHDQRNPAVNVTILDGNNATRILYVPQSSPCTIDGFTLENGNPSNASYGVNYGGAIYVDSNSFVTINDDLFTNNAGNGAAIYMNTGTGAPIITNCNFTGNNAASFVVNLYAIGSLVFSNNEFSGNNVAACCVDYYTGSGNLTFTNNTFLNNAGTLPTAVVNSLNGNGTFTIAGNMFSGNSSASRGNYGQLNGGALYAAFDYYNNGNGVMTVANNTFINNSGFWDGGACLQGSAIYFANTLILTGNIVHGNTAVNYGGGIGITGFNQVTIARNSITGNTASGSGGSLSGEGGGLLIYNGSPQLTIADNLIANNTSGADAAAIYLNGYNFTIHGQILNNTIVNNRCPASGSAISYGASNLTFANNIIVQNTIGLLDRDGSPTTLVTNDLYGNPYGNYSGVAPGATDISVDPMFVNANNGDYHLASASPAVDAGMDSYVSAGDTDLDGNARIYGAHVDLGCYEWSPTFPDITAINLSTSATPGGQSLSGTVTLAAPAITGGATVVLSYTSSHNVVSGPFSVTIPAGATSATFTIGTNPVAVNTTATVSAFYRGITKTATLTVMPYLATLTLAKPALASGTATTATLTLTAPAPAGGLIVTLTSANPAAVSVPATLTLKAGAKTVSFAVTAGTVSGGTSVAITAASGPQTLTATLVVNPAGVDLRSLALSASTLAGSQSSIGVVTLTAPAPTGGILVPLTNTNPSVVTMPACVIVPAGQNSVSFLITTSAITTNATAVISASVVTMKAVTLNVKANLITTLSLLPSPASVGDTVIGVVTLTIPAPAGGLTIPLSVDLPGVLTTDATVTIPAGQTIGLFYAEALTAGTAHVTANLNGALTTKTLVVNP